MVGEFSEILDQCKSRLFFYSPYRFMKGTNQDAIFDQTVRAPLLSKIDRGTIDVREISGGNEPHFVLIEPLSWDTDYFGFPVYKVLTVLYTHDRYNLLKKAMVQWTSEISNQIDSLYFIDVPSEDTHLIQALCECKFRLTETRLHFAFLDVGSYCHERYGVRRATENDIENLRKVAIEMRNPYDRLHADVAFKEEIADAYVATYIENSVRGFADFVLVPAEGNSLPDGFFTCSLHPERILGRRIAKVGIVATSSKTRKGWMTKLLSETMYILKDHSADCVLINTQASNRAVSNVLISAGFTLAFVTHILSNSIESHSSPNLFVKDGEP
jgi:dTDP-4-amino-4,6-dideoxy-D-galactose acyltransferase